MREPDRDVRQIHLLQDASKAARRKIDRFYCDKNVTSTTASLTKRSTVQRNVLFGTLLKVDNLDGGTYRPARAKRLLAGNALNGRPPIPGMPAARVEATQVKFADSMFQYQGCHQERHLRGHNQGVEVFHFATRDINAKMNADRPAKDQLYLRCGELHVEGRQFNDRTTQYMVAKHNVEFRTDKYLGYADVVKYDEGTEIVIFEGLNGNRVRLYDVSGERPREESVTTTKVIYNRKTGSMLSDGVKSISN